MPPRKKTKATDEGLASEVVTEEPKRGRPISVYTPELAEEICERIAEGETLRQVCRSKDIPPSTVRRWVLNDINGFSAQYAQARDLCIESWADELMEISDDATNDWMKREGKDGEDLGWSVNGDHVQRSRLRIDTRKWMLSKMKPDRYGDKVQLGGDADNPIRHSIIERTIIDPVASS